MSAPAAASSPSGRYGPAYAEAYGNPASAQQKSKLTSRAAPSSSPAPPSPIISAISTTSDGGVLLPRPIFLTRKQLAAAERAKAWREKIGLPASLEQIAFWAGVEMGYLR